MMLEQIMEVHRRFKAMPPILLDIWFVDSRREYNEFVSMLPVLEGSLDGMFGGVRVIEWYMHHYDPRTECIALAGEKWPVHHHDGLRHWPHICNIPGVWMRWNDGTWTRWEWSR